MATWQLQEAKARFSEVVDTAAKKGPQIITRHGVEAAVLVSITEWRRMFKPTPAELPTQAISNEEFLKFLQSAPDFEIPDRHAERAARRKAQR
jgi:antitoxin Phd